MNAHTDIDTAENDSPVIDRDGHDDRVKVDVWADVACAWCYIGTRKLKNAARSFTAKGLGGGRAVDIEFHSFELAPDLPLGPTQSLMDYNVNRMGLHEDQATSVLDRVTRLARVVDIEMSLDTTLVTNTVLAHQLIHYAKARGKQLEAEDALFAAYFTEGRNVSDVEELASMAENIGLDRADVVRSLTVSEYLSAVRADEDLARSYGITGVPFIVVDNKYGLSGAQDSDVMESALEKAWTDREQAR